MVYDLLLTAFNYSRFVPLSRYQRSCVLYVIKNQSLWYWYNVKATVKI